jgi:hypothetical protein
MKTRTHRFSAALVLGAATLILPLASLARTAKTCPDCSCVWVDPDDPKKVSETPVTRLVKPTADEKNPYNFVYAVASDPNAKKECKGKTCKCRIIVRRTKTIDKEEQVSDAVVEAGKGENSYRQGKFEKAQKELGKNEKIELLPACVLLDEDGEPEFGEAHK